MTKKQDAHLIYIATPKNPEQFLGPYFSFFKESYAHIEMYLKKLGFDIKDISPLEHFMLHTHKDGTYRTTIFLPGKKLPSRSVFGERRRLEDLDKKVKLYDETARKKKLGNKRVAIVYPRGKSKIIKAIYDFYGDEIFLADTLDKR